MIASARDTIGGPSRESRTPCSAAWFQRTMMLFSRGRAFGGRVAARPREGARRKTLPAPAACSSRRLDNDRSQTRPRSKAIALFPLGDWATNRRNLTPLAWDGHEGRPTLGDELRHGQMSAPHRLNAQRAPPDHRQLEGLR